jgi:hypothetical protein
VTAVTKYLKENADCEEKLNKPGTENWETSRPLKSSLTTGHINMEEAPPSDPHAFDDEPTAEEMANYGITREQITYYHCGKYRYTSYRSAVEQALRQQRCSKVENN